MLHGRQKPNWQLFFVDNDHRITSSSQINELSSKFVILIPTISFQCEGEDFIRQDSTFSFANFVKNPFSKLASPILASLKLSTWHSLGFLKLILTQWNNRDICKSFICFASNKYICFVPRTCVLHQFDDHFLVSLMRRLQLNSSLLINSTYCSTSNKTKRIRTDIL